MLNPKNYEFNSLMNVMEFIKPLIVEGYSVAINTVYKDVPFENSIDKFVVDVVKKGCKMVIYEHDKKSSDNEV